MAARKPFGDYFSAPHVNRDGDFVIKGAANRAASAARMHRSRRRSSFSDLAMWDEPQTEDPRIANYRHEKLELNDLLTMPVFDKKTGEAVLPLWDGSGRRRAERKRFNKSIRPDLARDERDVAEGKGRLFYSPNGTPILVTPEAETWGKEAASRLEKARDAARVEEGASLSGVRRDAAVLAQLPIDLTDL